MFGLKTVPTQALRAADADESKAILLAVLDNQPGPARDIVALNAGAAIYVSGLTLSLKDGVIKALEVLDSGAAKQKLDQLVMMSQSFKA